MKTPVFVKKHEGKVYYTPLKEKGHVTFLSHLNGSVDEKLLSDVVHKIKNGLGGIGGFAALLEKDLESEDPRKRLTKRIQDGVSRINEIVIHLMTLAQVLEPRFEKVRLLSLLKEVWRDYWSDEEKGDDLVSFHLDYSDGKLELLADPQMIRKMIFHAIRFANIVVGQIEAVKLNPRPGEKVDIEFYFLDNTSSVNLPDNIAQLMSECEPVEAKLSLAIVLKMAKMHGGKVSIDTLSGKKKVLTIQLLKGS